MSKGIIRKAVCALSAGVLSLSLVAGALAADNVSSADIKEADGTSGQNTNAGSGIKMDHIQNAAVTASKLATGAVTTSALADNAVETNKIATGAVTDAQISGTISTSKLNVGITAGTVASGDHNHDASYQRKYANVKVVSLDGNGDFTSPVDAMNSITDASAINPYLVKIMPGVYNIGLSTVLMKEYVDVEGSGENATTITGSAPNYYYCVLAGVSNAELRFLTVTATGTADLTGVCGSPKLTNVTVNALGGSINRGVWNQGACSMTNVTITASGGALGYGVWSESGSLVMNNVTITASGVGSCGVWNHTSSVMNNVTITASALERNAVGVWNVTSGLPVLMTNVAVTSLGGMMGNNGIENVMPSAVLMTNVAVTAKDGGGNVAMYNYGVGGSISIDRSTLDGAYSVLSSSGSNISIGASKLVGSFVADGTVTCVSSYNGNYAPLGSACQ